ncbi:erythromycin esterase family protein [Kordia sp.]|uniref:erythromycin esterase family protein n=1 Tax=Kordia sp. TaxID=1965332 RepID=UPI0025BFDE80|nr:erythromycin esterase family protein [Kordia sp.]MCH2196945.1 erythromycin esterase family protein [Kordia sp.]
MKYLFTFLLFALVTTATTAQCNADLKPYTTGFDSLKASSFSFLDTALTDVKIVGYGEDTHGTAEFTVLAEELMKYLSEKHDFKVLIIETGFGEGQYLNDYIHGKRDDLKTILNKHNSTWRYRTKEFYQLMNWLKSYNKNNDDPIYIYGCEMQYVISDVNRIKAYLQKVNSDFPLEGFEKHLWQQIEESEKTAYYLSYARLKQHFIDNYEAFVAESSEKEFSMAYQHVAVLGQFVTAIIQHVEQRKRDFRDIYMEQNIEWILNFHGTDAKAMYWAHNAHVGDWIDNGIVDVTGYQLRKRYGNYYYNIATDFGTGEFLAFSQEGKMGTFGHKAVLEDTFTQCLQSFGKPNAFVNFRKAREDKKLSEFLNSRITTMSGAGAQVRNSNTETKELAKAFDGVIYLDKTTKINWAD